MKTKTVITPELIEAVKTRFFASRNNTATAIAKEMNLCYSTTSKIIGLVLDEKMNLARRKNAVPNLNTVSHE